MTLSMAIFTFLNVWWISLFVVLPFHVRRETPASPVEYQAAPAAPRWKRVMLINTAVSLVITLIIAAIIHSGLFPMRELASAL